MTLTVVGISAFVLGVFVGWSLAVVGVKALLKDKALMSKAATKQGWCQPPTTTS